MVFTSTWQPLRAHHRSRRPGRSSEAGCEAGTHPRDGQVGALSSAPPHGLGERSWVDGQLTGSGKVRRVAGLLVHSHVVLIAVHELIISGPCAAIYESNVKTKHISSFDCNAVTDLCLDGFVKQAGLEFERATSYLHVKPLTQYQPRP